MDIEAERAYPTPYSNSSLLPLLLLSLATQRNAPKTATTFKTEYDYIIVGAGSAGSTLASRLTETSCVSVLLLEAGKGNIPLLNDVPTLGLNFWFTDLDWQFKTVPQRYTGEALVNREIIWPSGKGLGGSSILNGMLYIRGNRKNYDDWAGQGATGWRFEDVWPYFLKMEDNKNAEFLANGYHASGGPLTVENTGYKSEIEDPILEAAQKLGYTIVDSNAEQQTGFDDFQATFRNGQRCSTAKAYLVPAENRTNLDIITEAYVTKVIFKNLRAIGVQFDFQNSTYKVKARREVILSAGTVNTAQLLMLSGIGPKEHLKKLGIPVLVNLPVGCNLQDHCATIIPYQLGPEITPFEEKLTDPENVKEYIYERTGPLASTESLITTAFLNSGAVSPTVDFPDYQISFAEYSGEDIGQQRGLNSEIQLAGNDSFDGAKFICVSQHLQPKSRGTVRLKSSDPYDPPDIDPNYFEDPEDIKPIVEGIKTCNKIVMSESMQKVGAKPFDTVFPECEQFITDIDDYLTCIVQSFVITLSHPVGTAKMGDPRDPSTVVDPLLSVKGVKNLRIVDASVMPIIPSGNTNIPTIMIAEKAADIIKETIRCPTYDFTDYDVAKYLPYYAPFGFWSYT